MLRVSAYTRGLPFVRVCVHVCVCVCYFCVVVVIVIDMHVCCLHWNGTDSGVLGGSGCVGCVEAFGGVVVGCGGV